jgi:hypothetical protein
MTAMARGAGAASEGYLVLLENEARPKQDSSIPEILSKRSGRTRRNQSYHRVQTGPEQGKKSKGMRIITSFF